MLSGSVPPARRRRKHAVPGFPRDVPKVPEVHQTASGPCRDDTGDPPVSRPVPLIELCPLGKLTPMNTLGEYLRELRNKKDISLREFARKIGYTAAFVSDVELGRRFPSEKVLSDMAEALGAPVEELKRYDPRPPIEDLKRRSESDPQYAFALRRIVGDKSIHGDDLLKAIEGIEKEKDEER